MSALKDLIIDEIRADGPMPIDRYMELCLAHPVHGYYMKQDPFGADGHFTTAPEISQIFGEMIGLWCASRWERAGKPKQFAIVELGGGRGTLMGDLLRAVNNVKGFKPEIHMVEISPVLEAMQRRKLQDGATWHKEIPNLTVPTIFVANEFFDALPIKQFIGDKERMIIADGDNLAFNMPAEEGTVIETRPAALAILEQIINNSFATAICDYGYRQSTMTDTLQAVYRHKPAPVLENPGDADLTAHVDFGALISKAQKTGGLYSQREFLLGHGADLRAKILNKEADLARLIEPDQMGELFKVLCL